MSQKIRIKLKSYDHKLVDKSAEKIVKAVKATGAIISGPIPLPTHKRIFTVNRSTFVNKKSREQFQLSDYKRLSNFPAVLRLRSRCSLNMNYHKRTVLPDMAMPFFLLLSKQL